MSNQFENELTIIDDNTGGYVRVVTKEGKSRRMALNSDRVPEGSTNLFFTDERAVAALEFSLSSKVDKVAGKGLSTNDYTDNEKSKLGGIAIEATKNATDEQLRDRSTHTGTQSMSTVSGLNFALEGKVSAIVAGDNITVDNTDPQNPAISVPSLEATLGEWTQQTITLGNYKSIAWSAELGVYAAVGDVGLCSTSPDGINWTQRTIPSGSYYSIAWSAELGIFVAVGGGSKCVTATATVKFLKSANNLSDVPDPLAGFANLIVGISDYADDTAAASGGVAIGHPYRTGSILKVRVV